MKYLMMAMCVLVVGCGESRRVEDLKSISRDVRIVVDYDFGGRIEVVVVDGCEYVVLRDNYKGAITHKANCPNPEHRSRP